MRHFISTTVSIVALASLAMTAAATSTHKQKSKKTKAKAPVAKALPVTQELSGMAGIWTLRDGDKPRTDIKMKFSPNGSFAFIGPNWRSAGNYRVEDHKLRLEWTEVDGSPVAKGVMKKDFAMGEGDASFTIDKYTYYKLGSPIVTAVKPQAR